MRWSEIGTGRSARVTLVFAVVYAGYGCYLPYVSQWLRERHELTGLEIGIIISCGQVLRLAVAPLLGAWADSRADRKTALTAAATAAAVAFAAFFFAAEGFWLLLATGFLAQTALATLSPLLERSLLEEGMARRGLPYGLSRAIASSAFIVGSVVAGALIAAHGVAAAAWWVSLTTGVGAMAAWATLTPEPTPGGRSSLRGRLGEGMAAFKDPAFALPLVGANIIQSTHAFYYAFSVIVWAEQGISAGPAGLLWGVGVAAEVGFFLLIAKGYSLSPLALIATGGAAAALRWGAMAYSPSLGPLWPLQALHALTFAATHVGAMRLIQLRAPPTASGVVQLAYSGLGATLAGLAGLAAGALYDGMGVRGYLAMAWLAAVGLLAATTGLLFASKASRA